MVLNAGNPTGTQAGLTILKGPNDDVTVVAPLVSNPPADPGHSVQKAWGLTVTFGSLNGARVTASGTGSPSFYIGCDPTMPLPDSIAWTLLTTTGPSNARTAVMADALACNPRCLVLAT